MEGFFELVIRVGRFWGEDSLFSECVVPSRLVPRMVGESGKGDTILCRRHPLSDERLVSGQKFQNRHVRFDRRMSSVKLTILQGRQSQTE